MFLLLNYLESSRHLYIFNQTSLVIICERPSPVTTHTQKKKAENLFYFFSLTVEDYPPGMCRTFLGFFFVFTFFVTMWQGRGHRV
jgi:hypothetical protein